MVKDKLSAHHLYETLNPRFKAAFEWLKKHASGDIPDGRYELDGNKLVALPQGYNTHPFSAKLFETHKKYIDIQYIISGSEKIYLGDPSGMAVAVEFSEEKDIAFHDGRGPAVDMAPGDFMIIWPHEAHAPGCDPAAEAVAVRKIILKVVV